MSKVILPDDSEVEAAELGGQMAVRVLKNLAGKRYDEGDAEFPIQVLESEIAWLFEWVKLGSGQCGEDQAREAMRALCRYIGPYLWAGVETYGRHLREPKKSNVIQFRARR